MCGCDAEKREEIREKIFVVAASLLLNLRNTRYKLRLLRKGKP